MRIIDADELITDLKRLESEYLYADGNFKEYEFVYGALTGVRQAIIYAKNTSTMDVALSNKWISVEDRLPDEDMRVLVYLDTERSYTKMDTDRRFEGKWVRWGTDVTHWMPLPEPPAEKENNNDR